MENSYLFGADLFGNDAAPTGRAPLATRFLIPPFSVLNAQSGDWQERKAAWLSMGIKSEVGRDAKTYNIHDWLDSRPSARGKVGVEGIAGGGTSIFDPVLCELAYRWFCPHGGQIIDPFAGGSVRGIVAAVMGNRYWGCDLSSAQIEANIAQAAMITPQSQPAWVNGDSMEIVPSAPDADFLFTCPPYGDLEVYSDDPRDLSAMDFHAFTAAYRRIILKCSERLKSDSFACVVVGDFRCKKGFYRNFVSSTIEGFRQCGMELYNEAILVTPVGTAAMRVTKQFQSGRKMAKIHQNVLVFCKGDWRKAAAKCSKAANPLYGG